MNKYLRSLQHLPRYTQGSKSHSLKRFKKLIIGAVVAVIIVAIVFVVLIVMLFSWLFGRGGEQIEQTGKSLTENAQSLGVPSLDIQNYISDGQVDTKQLEQVYAALPTSMQDAWLNQLNAQIEELKTQAGVSDETIRALTDLYEALQRIQGE